MPASQAELQDGAGRGLTNVQHLTSNKLDPVARVTISTIQRLYSVLRGKEMDAGLEEGSLFDSASNLAPEPDPIAYNPALPVGAFDVIFIFIDECHRSIVVVDESRKIKAALRKRGITSRIARKGIESKEKLGRHRWVVERTHSWLNRLRRLKVRYERRADIHEAFLKLGCALICLNFIERWFC